MINKEYLAGELYEVFCNTEEFSTLSWEEILKKANEDMQNINDTWIKVAEKAIQLIQSDETCCYNKI